MDQAETQRLQEINSKLIQLYLRAEQIEHQEHAIWDEIQHLESEKQKIPHDVIYSDQVQQYVIILRSAASTLQLHRHSLHPFSSQSNSELSSDEIRQKNILLNKSRNTEKKIETYRKKLADVGLLPFEIDDIILEGYREQNQKHLQQLLQLLVSELQAYVRGHYTLHGTLPSDLLQDTQTWEASDDIKQLSSMQHKVVKIVDECKRKGIPTEEISETIQSVGQWNSKQKQSNLDRLKTKLKQEFPTLDDQDMATTVMEWIGQFKQNQRLSTNQTSIVLLIQDMQMYGVPQQQIDDLLNVESKDSGILSTFKNRFRRKS